LEIGLRIDVVLDLCLERGRIVTDEGIDNVFECQSRVSSPSVEVWFRCQWLLADRREDYWYYYYYYSQSGLAFPGPAMTTPA
jgi:hypothetical protein